MRARVLVAVCVLLVAATAPATSCSARTTGSRVQTTAAPSTTSNSTIPPGYKYYPTTGSYYKLHKSLVSMYHANNTCASERAHLLEINDAKEAEIVSNIMMENVGDYFTWTGLRDNRPGGVMEWRTLNGKPINDVFHLWWGNSPLNNAAYTCAVYGLYLSKRLWDTDCNSHNYYICEI